MRRKGWHHSEETKAKISAANAGRKRTPEQCARIGAALRGRKLSPEARANISAAMMGRTLSPEWRASIAAAKIGNANGRGNKGKKMNEASHCWKGDDIGYNQAFARLRKCRGKASDYPCPCGRQAECWSYSTTCTEEKRDITDGHAYCLHFTDMGCYEPLCRSCHKLKADAQRVFEPTHSVVL